MTDPTVCHPVGGGMPSPALQLHDQLLNDVKQLKVPKRLGNVEMDVALCHVNETPVHYSKSNICELIKTHKYTNAYIYLHPNHSRPSDASSDEVNPSTQSSTEPVDVLLANIERAAIYGHDVLISGGRSKKKRNQKSLSDPSVLYLRCQCALLYQGKKVLPW